MAAFRTITARKPGTCQRCGEEFPAGTKIRWAAGSGSWHLASECPAAEERPATKAMRKSVDGEPVDRETEVRWLTASMADLQKRLDALMAPQQEVIEL